MDKNAGESEFVVGGQMTELFGEHLGQFSGQDHFGISLRRVEFFGEHLRQDFG